MFVLNCLITWLSYRSLCLITKFERSLRSKCVDVSQNIEHQNVLLLKVSATHKVLFRL